MLEFFILGTETKKHLASELTLVFVHPLEYKLYHLQLRFWNWNMTNIELKCLFSN